MSFPGSDLVHPWVGNGGVVSALVGGWRHRVSWTQGRVLVKDTEVLVLASAQLMVLLPVPLFPPVKWE